MLSDNLSQSELIAHLERSLIDAMNKYDVPGLSIAVIHQYSIIWSRAFGVLQAGQVAPIRADTSFKLAPSVSQSRRLLFSIWCKLDNLISIQT